MTFIVYYSIFVITKKLNKIMNINTINPAIIKKQVFMQLRLRVNAGKQRKGGIYVRLKEDQITEENEEALRDWFFKNGIVNFSCMSVSQAFANNGEFRCLFGLDSGPVPNHVKKI